MEKAIYWMDENGIRYEGTATLEDGILALRNDRGEAFSLIEKEDIKNGATLEDIFEDIPEDVTDFEL